jgi:hypothetical protein
MLYNPKWDKETTLLGKWIAWLKTKNPSESYDWTTTTDCACGEFYGGGGWEYITEFGLLNSIAQGEGCSSEWTFGKCLERARLAK